MRLFNKYITSNITSITIGSIALSAVILMLVFYWQIDSSASSAAQSKAISDLNVTETILDLKYPGNWNIKKEKLYKGQTSINDNYSIVDEIRVLTGNSCAVFLNNICVATTVPEGECNRAIGLYAPYEVISKNLVAGHYYTGQAKLAGENHSIAYKPIKTEYNEIIGVLYVAVPMSPYHALYFSSIKQAGLVACCLSLLIGMAARFFIVRAVKRQAMPARTQGLAVGLHRKDKRSVKIHQTGKADITDTLGMSKTEQDPSFISNTNREEAPELVDPLFDSLQDLPKGLNRITLKQIIELLKQKEDAITIPDVSEALSLSRVTVRHYFDYLYENNFVDIEQKYGSIGRPQRIYKLKV